MKAKEYVEKFFSNLTPTTTPVNITKAKTTETVREEATRHGISIGEVRRQRKA